MSTDYFNAPQPPEAAPAWLEKLQQRIGYDFKDRGLLLAALTHASGAEHRLASNERLEFLGDAILGAVVCEILYHQYPEYLEGDLTRIKSIVVSRLTCAKISAALGMQEFLILGKGMTTHPSVPSSLLADVFESLVAAIYLDGGDAAARAFIVPPSGRKLNWRRRARPAATTSPSCSNWRNGSTARRRPISCWTRKGPIIASASRSRPKSAATATRRLGDGTRKKQSNARPATP